MDLVSVRIVTDDVARLVDFYELATGAQARWATPDFAEVVTASGTLAIAGTRTMALYEESPARAADNHSVFVEFRVDDVDAEHQRLRDTVDVVQTPTTMPWGNRSLLLRDPDGNLVNFFSPATPS